MEKEYRIIESKSYFPFIVEEGFVYYYEDKKENKKQFFGSYKCHGFKNLEEARKFIAKKYRIRRKSEKMNEDKRALKIFL